MIADLRNLIAAEWLKLRKRPLSWILLASFLGLVLLSFTLWLLVLMLHTGSLNVQITALAPEQLAEIQRQQSFPGIFGAVLGQINGVGGIFAIILAAGFVGGDYGWGTLRNLFVRAPQRGLYLVAKLITLLLGLTVAILIALVIGILFALMSSAILGLPNELSARDILLVPVGILRALYIILPYLLVTMFFAILGRSTLAGAGGGLIFLALDVSAGSFGALGSLDPRVLMLVNLLLQQNINTLVVLNSQTFGLNQAVLASSLDLQVLPSPLQATLIIALYCASFFWASYRLLTRRDISSAS